MLRALAGDCFLLDFENGSCILIDGGYKETYFKSLKNLLLNLSKEGKYLEYLILTHYDEDHIGGLLSLLEENGKSDEGKIIHIENIITNGFSNLCHTEDNSKIFYCKSINHDRTEEISASQQLSFETLCLKNGYQINECTNDKYILQGCVLYGKGYKIKFLTPNLPQLNSLVKYLEDEFEKRKLSYSPLNFQNYSMYLQERKAENKTVNISSTYCDDISQWKQYFDKGSPLNLINRCSLSFEIEFNEKHLLFCGDSDMNAAKDLLIKKYDVIKLSHHGTYYGNQCFIGKNPIISDNYIISTNSIRANREHPNRKLLSEILTLPHNKKFYFNYNMSKVKNELYYLLTNAEQQRKYKFSCFFDYYYLNL